MVSLKDGVEKARGFVSRLGVAGSVRHFARRVLTSVPAQGAKRFFLVVLSRPRPTPEAVEAARGHTFRFATRSDLEALLNVPDTGVGAFDLESFDRGSRCLLQHDGDALVGYTWVSTEPMVELLWGLHFNMPDDMAYNFNGFTVPSRRGTSFQALRHLKLLEALAPEGKRRLLGYVNHINFASLQGVAKSGYQRVGVLHGVRRLGRLRFFLSVDADAWSELTRSGPVQQTVKAAPRPAATTQARR